MLTLRLIRLLRLTKLVRLLDVNRVLRLVKAYYDKAGGEDRLQSQYSVMLFYKIFRLTLIAMMTTYFIGSFWYYLSDKINSVEDKMNENTFVFVWGFDQFFDETSPAICKKADCI